MPHYDLTAHRLHPLHRLCKSQSSAYQYQSKSTKPQLIRWAVREARREEPCEVQHETRRDTWHEARREARRVFDPTGGGRARGVLQVTEAV